MKSYKNNGSCWKSNNAEFGLYNTVLFIIKEENENGVWCFNKPVAEPSNATPEPVEELWWSAANVSGPIPEDYSIFFLS